MNDYIQMIDRVLTHLDHTLPEKQNLREVAAFAGISDFHFHRIFHVVTGQTLKQYILNRKLTTALISLRVEQKSVLNTALDLGFESPEVFSRNFRRQFGISPSAYQKSNVVLAPPKRPVLVEREIINIRGSLSLQGHCVFLETLTLAGIRFPVHTSHPDFEADLRRRSEGFLGSTVGDARFAQQRFFTMVTCSGKDDDEYQFFSGREPAQTTIPEGYQRQVIPAGWYADFTYQGDMFDIRGTFSDDLYRWVIVKEARLCANGVGMLNLYAHDYPENRTVHILIPVEEPVS